MMAYLVLTNLSRQWAFEQRLARYVLDDIWSLTGLGVVTSVMLEAGGFHAIRADYRDRVLTAKEEDSPIVRNHFRNDGSQTQHWPVWQQHERLFT